MAVTKPTVFAKRLNGGNGSEAPIEWFKESDSLSKKEGQWVRINDAGVLEAASATSMVVGILAADTRNVTSDSIANTPVVLAEPDVIFECQVFHSTAASAITAASMAGKSYAFKLSAATGIDAIDIETAAAATDQLSVHKLSPKDAVGDAYGRVWVRVNSSNYQFGVRRAH